MKAIVAADKNWAIGKGNDLLVKIPMDQKFFRQETSGHVVVMGRKTLESFPGGMPLKNRTNIVLTRRQDYDGKGALVVHSLEELLEELKKYSDIVPAVNQIEFHPYCYQKDLLEYCQDRGIQVQAYAPLARGAYFDNDVMCVLATKYVKTPAQIGLRWALQKGVAVIPKSSDPERIRINGDIFDFEIEEEDMEIIDSLNQNLHVSHVPEDLRDVPF